MKYSMMIAAAAVMTASAWAGPITTPPPVIMALGGNVTAVYVFADAGDTSILGLATPPPVNPIFCNYAVSGTCAANTAGNTVSLGIRSGLLTFTLNDTTTGKTYNSVTPDADGNYHAKITTNYADFGEGALPSAAASVIAGLPNVTYVGWEDHSLGDSGHDWDYNDLIFAFSATTPSGNPGVPEPLTLSLMGAGLLGAFGLRRAKKTKA